MSAPSTSHAIGVPPATHSEAVNSCVWPSAMEITDGEIVFELAQVIVTLAAADLELSAVLVAVTVTMAGDGGTAGAIYRPVVTLFDAPVETIVPSAAVPPAIPFTFHRTLAAAAAPPVTVAVKTCAPPDGTVAIDGEMLTTIVPDV